MSINWQSFFDQFNGKNFLRYPSVRELFLGRVSYLKKRGSIFERASIWHWSNMHGLPWFGKTTLLLLLRRHTNWYNAMIYTCSCWKPLDIFIMQLLEILLVAKQMNTQNRLDLLLTNKQTIYRVRDTEKSITITFCILIRS